MGKLKLTKDEIAANIDKFTSEELDLIGKDLGVDFSSAEALQPRAADTFLKTTAKVLDYPAGITRTAVAAAIEGGTGKKLIKEGDVEKALKGEAPRSSEFLERGGVPKGEIAGGVGTRDVLGFAADVVLDPTTMVSAMITKGAKLASPLAQRMVKTVTRPATTITEPLSRSLVKAAYKGIDAEVPEGVRRFSEIALKHNISGGGRKALNKTKKVINDLGKKRDAIYEVIDNAGETVNMSKAMMPAKQYIAKNLKGPNKMAAQKMRDVIIDLENDASILLPGGVLPQKAERVATSSKWKTSMRNLAGDSTFNEVKNTNFGKEVTKLVGDGMQKEIETTAARVAPELKTTIIDLNKDMGGLISSRKPLLRLAKSEAKTSTLTPFDALMMMTGAGAGGSTGDIGDIFIGGLAGLAAKKSIQASMRPGFKTAASKVIQSPFVDTASRQALVQSQQ